MRYIELFEAELPIRVPEHIKRRYMRGDCLAFALALQKHLKKPLWGLLNEKGEIHHVFLADPEQGIGYDVRGAISLSRISEGALTDYLMRPVSIEEVKKFYAMPTRAKMKDAEEVVKRSFWRLFEESHDYNIDAYHGTDKDISAFQLNKNPQGVSGSREGPIGFWFTNNPQTAAEFALWASRGLGGENVIPVKLRIHHPWIVHSYIEIKDLVDRFTKFKKTDYVAADGRNFRMIDDVVDYDGIRNWFKQNGYDGIILKDTLTDSPDQKTRIDQYVVFDPSQIKSRFEQ